MDRITIGGSRRRNWKKEKRVRGGWEDTFFALGLLLVGVMLIVPAGRREARERETEAAAVQCLASQEREIVRQADPYDPGADWSVFDAIGTFFAEMIFGK